ncbi:MAG: hypothetical protein E6614_31845, partial [Bradyrhizobium sp.]|nr:hypothetical protein [Bradyrhizobium sp.]
MTAAIVGALLRTTTVLSLRSHLANAATNERPFNRSGDWSGMRVACQGPKGLLTVLTWSGP